MIDNLINLVGRRSADANAGTALRQLFGNSVEGDTVFSAVNSFMGLVNDYLEAGDKDGAREFVEGLRTALELSIESMVEEIEEEE